MIIKSSTRGSQGLGAHLAADENERAEITAAGGIVSGDAASAIAELTAQGTASSTAKPLVHASVSPGPDEDMAPEQWLSVWQAWEDARGLRGQPYIEVEHLKHDRVHRHRVYSRVDPERGAAIRQSHEYRVNERVARQLEHEFDHKITPGAHSRSVLGWADANDPELAHKLRDAAAQARPEAAMTPDAWQQQERTGIDARAVASAAALAWQQSDSHDSLAAALDEHGLRLAQGHTTPQLIDSAGGSHDLRRTVRAGGVAIRKRDITARLHAELPSVEAVRAEQTAPPTPAPAASPIAEPEPSAVLSELAEMSGEQPEPKERQLSEHERRMRAEADEMRAEIEREREKLKTLAQRACKEKSMSHRQMDLLAQRRAGGAAYKSAQRERQRARHDLDAARDGYRLAKHEHRRYEGIVGAFRSLVHPKDARQRWEAMRSASAELREAKSRYTAATADVKSWQEALGPLGDRAGDVERERQRIRDDLHARREYERRHEQLREKRRELRTLEHNIEQQPERERQREMRREHDHDDLPKPDGK